LDIKIVFSKVGTTEPRAAVLIRACLAVILRGASVNPIIAGRELWRRCSVKLTCPEKNVRDWAAPNLFRELEVVRADGSMLGLLQSLAHTTLLIVDDLGISNVSGTRCQ
jgi:hypothetical protein